MENKSKDKEPNFWDCKHGIFAGECYCKTGGLCPLELGGTCKNFEDDNE